MPLTTTSPQHSFVNFEHKLDIFIMPVYGTGAVAFQILLDAANEIPLTDTISAGISDLNGHVLYESTDVVESACTWGRIKGINFEFQFPLFIAAGQPVPAGLYNTPADFFAGLRTIGLGAFDKDFIHCCPHDNITFHFNTGQQATIEFYKALLQVSIPSEGTAFGSDLDVDPGECIYYFIKHTSGVVFSNNFKRVPDDKFLTRVTYSSNEDAYGFLFKNDSMFNQVWLPLVSRNPLYPSTRKVYMMSNKKYKVQSSSVEKEYQCKTDRLPEVIHDKIVVALEMDNVYFKNRKVDGAVFRKDDYTIDWTDDDFVDSDTAIAKFKVQQTFEGRNSNCEKRKVCAEPQLCVPVSTNDNSLPDGVVGEFYGPVINLSGDGPFVPFIVGAPGWLATTIIGDQLFITGVPDTPGPSRIWIRVSNCNGANTVEIDHTITLGTKPVPSLVQTVNTSNGTTRTQVFDVGANVNPGNLFTLVVYSHIVTVTAVAGDTPTTIAQKLVTAINSTTAGQWNDHGSAPASGTPGFPPSAASSVNQVTLTLNALNQFAGYADVF